MATCAAKRKEAIILAIDIGKNSTQLDSDGKTYFEKSIRCVSMIIKRKILTGNEDHLAIVLLGSYHTTNRFLSQGVFFFNIEIFTRFGVATWDLLNRVNSLCTSNITPSDWINTFVLAADILKNENKNKFYTGLQIIMFSNLATDISFDNIDEIASDLKMENINVTIIGEVCEAMLLNPAFNAFIKTTEATSVNFDLVLPKLSYYKQKEVTTKSWNTPLSFGGVFYLKVFGYEKIDVTTKSSNWLFSKNYDTEDPTTAMKKHSDENDVKMEANDNKLLIDDFYPDDEIIPIICNTNESTYIAYTQKCLQVLGFTKTTNTHRLFLMDGGSYIFKPYKKGIIAFNAIFDSMVEREEVMVVRKVDLFTNLLNIGALFPKKEDNEKFFVYVNLPYDDKKYKYKFPPLNSIKSNFKELIVSPEHKDAMNVDLDGNIFAIPENKYDYGVRLLYECIVQQIFAKIIPEKIECSVNPPKGFTETSNLWLDNIMKLFLSEDGLLKSYPAIDDPNTSFYLDEEELAVSKRCVISSLNPIEDFNKFLNDGIDPAIVCEEMQQLTLHLIRISHSLQSLLAPVSTLMTLRGYYITNNDAKSYNNFMYLVKELFRTEEKTDMWPKFINSERGLITRKELKASDISQKSSEEFMDLKNLLENIDD